MKFNRILRGNEVLIQEIIDFFCSSVIDKSKYEEIIKICSESPISSQNPNHDIALKLGALSVNDFLHYSSQQNKKMSIKPLVVESIMDRFCEVFIFSKEKYFQYFGETTYSINKDLASFFYGKDLLYNLLFGFTYIAEKYKQNVFKIIIHNDDESQNIGTGFSFRYADSKGEKHALIITNKHVASHSRNIQVLNYKDQIIEHKEITNSEKFDLAIIEVSPDCCDNTFHFYHELELLDEIITIGYPPIATTMESYQVVHKGEINAFVKDFWGSEYILFSAKTAPGNSGGPLINNMGLVAGIVTKSLEHKNHDSIPSEAYYAAIPAQDIINFINNEHLSKSK